MRERVAIDASGRRTLLRRGKLVAGASSPMLWVTGVLLLFDRFAAAVAVEAADAVFGGAPVGQRPPR